MSEYGTLTLPYHNMSCNNKPHHVITSVIMSWYPVERSPARGGSLVTAGGSKNVALLQ